MWQPDSGRKKSWEEESYKCTTMIFIETKEVQNHSSESHQVTQDLRSHLVKFLSIFCDGIITFLKSGWLYSDAPERLGAP